MNPLEGYETVAERIQRFYGDNPDGAIQTQSVEFVELQGKSYVLVKARAYRAPDDARPGTGTAMDPAPGLNRFTQQAFVETAETSAWGRALASLGYGGQQIATKDEVQAVAPEAKPDALSTAATEFIAWVAKEKVPADKIKLTLGALGIAVGNKRLKTVLTGMSDEQIAVLKGRLS